MRHISRDSVDAMKQRLQAPVLILQWSDMDRHIDKSSNIRAACKSSGLADGGAKYSPDCANSICPLDRER